jgi:hypothetical protein
MSDQIETPLPNSSSINRDQDGLFRRLSQLTPELARHCPDWSLILPSLFFRLPFLLYAMEQICFAVGTDRWNSLRTDLTGTVHSESAHERPSSHTGSAPHVLSRTMLAPETPATWATACTGGAAAAVLFLGICIDRHN